MLFPSPFPIKTEPKVKHEPFDSPSPSPPAAAAVPAAVSEAGGGGVVGGAPKLPTRRRLHKPLAPKPIALINRRRLSGILRHLTRAHNWRESSAVLAVLLQGATRRTSFAEHRREFTVAMEVLKRLGPKARYGMVIKQIYEVWMSKLAWTKKGDKRKHEISLELVLFHLSQGDIEAARDSMRFLVEDPDSANAATVNLVYGLILYQLWYSHLVKEMNLKGFNFSVPSETYGMSYNDDGGESETLETSKSHDALDIRDARLTFRCSSESSVGDVKNVFVDCKNNLPATQDGFRSHGFYTSRSLDANEDGVASPDHEMNLSTSIFLAHGLDPSLLPIQLKHTSGDLQQTISTYRKLANENYRDAVKHLRLALYSRQPLLPALLPLIQLLMLGDRVEEALKELENFCDYFNAALPFRLRARLLEVFHNKQTTLISSCYENVLKRDPTCNQSLKALIRMQKTGNYTSLSLLEMIASQLDAVNGSSVIWEEFASCFLRLQSAAVSEYEDCISVNIYRGQTNFVSSTKVPNALTSGYARDTWRLRCKWWMTRHFSNTIFLSEMHAGDWQLLTSKAACASHLYGPRFEYVISVHSKLGKEAQKDHMSFLLRHIEHSMKLSEGLH